ncbi:hypothetical protein AWM70_04620 [Paenibacillus yonginensis]|uniref:Methyltransferase domain-containing protein n=1 Tax=Paenibacillus yonginensis TaxID=1462996 RepID=A0A1B1MXR1_9BACL|nr:class I SAM-dependent methyltransferase [Paenibacillus yonginensis]ANS73939.1 hypothetical protein AWM70_04620 [Paenibacillus yonginensis]
MDKQGFNQWAPEYEQTVDRTQGYPFEGYDEVLKYCRNQRPAGSTLSILDIGIGTGRLSQELYEQGHEITGLDFSEEMLRIAAERMPKGRFYKADFAEGIPGPIMGVTFSCILSTYAFHHVDDDRKIQLLRLFAGRLRQDGVIAIGDIGFRTSQDRERCRLAAGDRWDEEEWYIAADEFLPKLNKAGFKASYRQVSGCAGVLTLTL